MNLELTPVVGEWYRRLDRPQPFQVVAFDDDSVEIEYFDGTLDEWPKAHWHGLEIEPCDAPQDWTGPFDNVERDDLGVSESDMTPEDWREPVEGPQDEGDRRTLEAERRAIPPAQVGPKPRAPRKRKTPGRSR
ncbi:MAG: hypothetical protein ISP90_03160 [Nevskia sp.]|nr:hypothetical protein [Nevskia sp.]